MLRLFRRIVLHSAPGGKQERLDGHQQPKVVNLGGEICRFCGELEFDMAMPGLSGMNILNKLRMQEGATTVPILIYTAVPGMVDDGARATVDGILVKSVENETLLAEICRILESRAEGAVFFLSPRVWSMAPPRALPA